MITKEEIIDIGIQYGICVTTIGEMINSSRGVDDQRFNYPLNGEYMLKINNASFLTEAYLSDVANLIDRYHSIHVDCPRLVRSKAGCYLYKMIHGQKEYYCYIEEYSRYRIADSITKDPYQIKKEMMWHLGKLASRYTNVNLVETRSMWSLIELAPLDIDIDEKQENMNALMDCLCRSGYKELAGTLDQCNQELRNEIQCHLKELPRCVYQGDLNSSNVLVDEQDKFVGVIDFNMHGTEININCFLNETMYYLTRQDFLELTSNEIFEKMNRIQKELLDIILAEYTLNPLEEYCMLPYRKIIYLSFYPNVMLWNELMKEELTIGKVIELIKLIIEMSW